MKNLWVKVIALTIAFLGVIWLMKALQDDSLIQNPNNPMNALTAPQTTIRAKVKINETSKASK